jgi:hypothetical protein
MTESRLGTLLCLGAQARQGDLKGEDGRGARGDGAIVGETNNETKR